MGSKLERYMRLSPDEVLPLITSHHKSVLRPELHGVPCNLSGLRLFTFKDKGLKCVNCGIEGSFFAIERSPNLSVVNRDAFNPDPYHLNLYAVGDRGQEVLMTHDHILARCLGGKDVPDNAQTMCEPCNAAKGRQEQIVLGQKLDSGEITNYKAVKNSSKRSAERRARRTHARKSGIETRLVAHILNGGVPNGSVEAFTKKFQTGFFSNPLNRTIIERALIEKRGLNIEVEPHGIETRNTEDEERSEKGSAVVHASSANRSERAGAGAS